MMASPEFDFKLPPTNKGDDDVSRIKVVTSTAGLGFWRTSSFLHDKIKEQKMIKNKTIIDDLNFILKLIKYMM
jgi:hypothetical protein